MQASHQPNPDVGLQAATRDRQDHHKCLISSLLNFSPKLWLRNEHCIFPLPYFLYEHIQFGYICKIKAPGN